MRYEAFPSPKLCFHEWAFSLSRAFTVSEIELSEGMTSSYRENLKFIQQMDGTAEIITREMRLITRLINPLKAFFDSGR